MTLSWNPPTSSLTDLGSFHRSTGGVLTTIMLSNGFHAQPPEQLGLPLFCSFNTSAVGLLYFIAWLRWPFFFLCIHGCFFLLSCFLFTSSGLAPRCISRHHSACPSPPGL